MERTCRIVAVILLLGMGCGDSDNPNNSPQNQLVGSWTLIEVNGDTTPGFEEFFVFNETGTFVQTVLFAGFTASTRGTYTVSGGTVTCTPNPDENTSPFSLTISFQSDGDLVTVDNSGRRAVYSRN